MKSSQQDVRMAKAMSHPVRVEALRILNERVASPSEIAREIDLPIANVAYHVNALLRLGCVEEVETRAVRGALEHRYRAKRRPVAELADTASMPPSVRHSLAAAVYENAFADAHAALQSGAAEHRPDVHFIFTPMTLDEEAWRNVYGILDDARAAIEREQQSARARLQEGGEPIRSRLTIMHYQGADESA